MDEMNNSEIESKTRLEVEFDPGFAPLVMESLGQVGYNYYVFSSIPDKKLKRLNFNAISKKLESNLEINVAFYMGCLLWASYISQFENYKINGNKLLGETCEEKEYTGELDFLIDFIENKYPRDVKYYQNKTYEPDKRYIPILKAYREFLVINKGFCECSNTSQILLPKQLKKIDNDTAKKIKDEIFNAIEKQDLTLLLELFEVLF